MSTILDYLSWRGDLSIEQDKFNEIDALILARLSYLPFDDIVPSSFLEKITIKEAVETLLTQEDYVSKLTWKYDQDLLIALKDSRRFNSMYLSGYLNEIDSDQQKQFCAITITFSKNKHYVSFRGTDRTLVGWKEDFNMSFMDIVPSQQSSKDYLQRAISSLRGRYIIGGHSKGGNLAMYASIKVLKKYQSKIDFVYNFDGPGFELSFFESNGYLNMKDKICTYLPESSIVGMLLEHKEHFIVVQSDNNGIMQHDIYSWQLMNKAFIKKEQLSKESQIINESIKEWTQSVDEAGRKQFIDTIYTLLSETDVNTVEEFLSYKNIMKIVSSLKNVNEEDKKHVMDLLVSLVKILSKNFVS